MPDGSLTRENLAQTLAPLIPRLRLSVRDSIPIPLRKILSEDDVLQEVWADAVQGCGKVRSLDEPALMAWLRSIAEHCIIDAVRRGNAQKRGGGRPIQTKSRFSSICEFMDRLRAPATTPSGEVRKAEAAHVLSLTLDALSEDRRKLVELHFLEGLEVADVAEAVGRPASTVRRLLAQTLRELRARIRQLGLGSDA